MTDRNPRVIFIGEQPVSRREALAILDRIVDQHDGVVDLIFPTTSLADSALPKISEIIGNKITTLDYDNFEISMIFLVPQGAEDAPDDGIVEDLGDRAATWVAKTDSSEYADLVQEAVRRYAKAGLDTIALVYDDEDEDTNLALELAMVKGVETRDINNGYETFLHGAETNAPAEEEEPEPEPPVEPVKRARKAAPKVDVEEPVEEPEDAQEESEDVEVTVEDILHLLVETLADRVADRALEFLIERSKKD